MIHFLAFLIRVRLLPVIAIPKADDVIPLCEALGAGGLKAAEITFRTEAGRKGLQMAVSRFPDFLIGAGTVTRVDEVKLAADSGALFAVAPGTNPSILSAASQRSLPFFPGVCTPSEIEMALELGCRTLKFFPAEQAGGVKFLKAIAAPYAHREVRFIPTGGIDEGNAISYLSLKEVLAVGGSWIVAPELLAAGDWKEVERRTSLAVKALQGA